MMDRRLPQQLDARLRLATGVLAALVLAGCATVRPAPTAKLQAAQQAIASAERTEAGRYAAGELGAARSKLASAESAVSEKKMDLAGQFADESRAEAELASARTSNAYLVGQGVSAVRLTAVGKGKSVAIASNDSAEGRQQNRRVEVVISNTPAASL